MSGHVPPIEWRNLLMCEVQLKHSKRFERRNAKCYMLSIKVTKGKGKAIPLQVWTGPEGSRRLRLPDFKTTGT
jgi:hypothetical protein